MENSWFKHRILIIYVLISINIFNSIYETSKSVVDELFHVKQGMNYCFGFYYEVILMSLALLFNPLVDTAVTF